RLDEVSQRRFADADVAADLVILDPPFRDQATDEPRLGPQPLSRLLHIHQHRRCPRLPAICHAALPVAGTSVSSCMAALRLASVSATCHRARSATACSSRRACSMWSGSPGVTGSQEYRPRSVAEIPRVASS